VAFLEVSLELSEQLDRARVLSSGKCSHSAGDIGCHRAQEFAQLTCCPGIEAAIGALGRARDLTKDPLDVPIVAFLKHEGLHAQASELTGLGDDLVRILFQGIPDKDQRADLEQRRLLAGMSENLP